jgi:lipopolysaccharide transport system ATP-binding protein
MKPAISVTNVGKQYKLGLVHTDLLSEKLGNGLRAIGDRLRGGERRSKSQAQQLEKESFWALKDINFEVQPGEVMGVIGSNGAGKSTLLKILSRITSPTTGEIQLQGRVASLLEVGTGFHPELTGRENIFLNGSILGMTRQEINKKFDEIVAFAEVEKFIDTPVKRYSSGMYVRLAFAVAAHLEPEILVVDEVLAVGDVAFQKKCLSKMEDVSGEGRTVLFVSHNMASIKRLCHSAILLEAGQLKMLGEAHKVISHYYEVGQTSGRIVHFDADSHKVKSPFQIQQLEIQGDGPALGPTVYSDQPIQLRMGIIVKQELTNVRIGIEVYREGVLVTNFHTENMAFESSTNMILVSCQIPASTLMPGFYDIHVGAHNSMSGAGLDQIPDAFSFQILDVHSAEDGHNDARARGFVRVPVTWSVS